MTKHRRLWEHHTEDRAIDRDDYWSAPPPLPQSNARAAGPNGRRVRLRIRSLQYDATGDKTFTELGRRTLKRTHHHAHIDCMITAQQRQHLRESPAAHG
jgi:hypothetical protein